MNRLFRLLALDLRSLAVFRIAFGLVIIQDILIRCTDLVAHYTDFGAMPRAAVLELGWQPQFWSFNMMNGTWPFQALLFALGALAALCMAVGYQTRWATLAAWLHLVSLHSRNPLVLDGGDTYIRNIMFWCMFLPWGARWSIDAYRDRRDPEEPNQYLDVSTLAYLLQMTLIYSVAALLKTDACWRVNHTATYKALMIDQLATPLAPLLLAHPDLMKWLTVGCMGFEGYGPILFWLGPQLRFLGALGVSSLHLGFGLFMHLGVFAVIGQLAPLGMWPGFLWDRLERKGLFRSLQGAGRRLAESWPAPGFSPSRPEPLSGTTRVCLVFLLTYVFLWNLTTIPGVKLPFPVYGDLGRILRLDQQWNMFAPKPLEEDGWYVIDAEKVDGSHIDLYTNGGPLNWDKPAHVASQYPNARWRKFMMNLWSKDLSSWRLHYGRYLTRNWNGSHKGGDQIKTFKIFFMLETTLDDGKTRPVEKIMLWHHQCFDKPATPAKDEVKSEETVTPSATPAELLPTPGG